MESRRPDVVLLVGDGVLVVELKGKTGPSQADIDQAAAYARDSALLSPRVLPTGRSFRCSCRRGRGVRAAGHGRAYRRAGCPRLVNRAACRRRRSRRRHRQEAILGRSRRTARSRHWFRPHASCFTQGVRRILVPARQRTPLWRPSAEVIHHAAATRSRHLVLVTGVPGAGKTLVGLRNGARSTISTISRCLAQDGQPTVPAVFLSGNGPLVKSSVRIAVRRWRRQDVRPRREGLREDLLVEARKLVPPEHVLVFDEAQRAFDAEMVQLSTRTAPEPKVGARAFRRVRRTHSRVVRRPRLDRRQEIHVGEEAGSPVAMGRRMCGRSPSSGRSTPPSRSQTCSMAAGAASCTMPR